MTDYTELVKALRCCDEYALCNDCPIFETCDGDVDKAMAIAADAIEAINRLVDLNTERCDGLRKQLREAHENYEKHLNELEAQLPKRGEWVGIEYDGYADGNPVYDVWECSECGEEHEGEEDTLTNYCPNCGAKMTGEQDVE